MKSFKTFIEKNDNDPCWDGYKQVGWKKKDGKKVPNCVPIGEGKENVVMNAMTTHYPKHYIRVKM